MSIDEKAITLLKRYRDETPLGHQPHMIAHQADAVIAAYEAAKPESARAEAYSINNSLDGKCASKVDFCARDTLQTEAESRAHRAQPTEQPVDCPGNESHHFVRSCICCGRTEPERKPQRPVVSTTPELAEGDLAEVESDLCEYLEGFEQLSKHECEVWASKIMQSVIRPHLRPSERESIKDAAYLHMNPKIKIMASGKVPDGEVWICNLDDKIVGKIVNIGSGDIKEQGRRGSDVK